MNRRICVFVFCVLSSTMVSAQTTKTRLNEQQIWLGYFNQTRVTNKFGFWGDFHIRTKENFVDNFYQSIVRPGITYFITDSTRLTVGYAYVENYPAEGHASVTQPEHRFWQQVQWRTNYGKTRMMQWIRLEEKYKHKVLNDSTLGDGYNFNYKIRYNFSYEIPFSQKRTNKVSFQINDEIHINFGKQIVYNYFDQNRFFVGLKLIFTQNSYIQCGYMNQFQQLASGNRYRNNNAIRLFYYQNLDLRHKKG